MNEIMFPPKSDIGYNVSAFDMLHILKIYFNAYYVVFNTNAKLILNK